jgi:hypothetical protein
MPGDGGKLRALPVVCGGGEACPGGGAGWAEGPASSPRRERGLLAGSREAQGPVEVTLAERPCGTRVPCRSRGGPRRSRREPCREGGLGEEPGALSRRASSKAKGAFVIEGSALPQREILRHRRYAACAGRRAAVQQARSVRPGPVQPTSAEPGPAAARRGRRAPGSLRAASSAPGRPGGPEPPARSERRAVRPGGLAASRAAWRPPERAGRLRRRGRGLPPARD